MAATRGRRRASTERAVEKVGLLGRFPGVEALGPPVGVYEDTLKLRR